MKVGAVHVQQVSRLEWSLAQIARQRHSAVRRLLLLAGCGSRRSGQVERHLLFSRLFRLRSRAAVVLVVIVVVVMLTDHSG